MNEIANYCEKVGADVDKVRLGMGSDDRIGHRFLFPGIGYGGSCFPKDVKALINTGKQTGYPMRIIEAVDSVNEFQKSIVYEKLHAIMEGNMAGKQIAIWGLSFKPETDDMREAPSLVVIEKLIVAGAQVKVYDPIAMEETKRRIGDVVLYCNDIYDAAIDADAILLLTEWKQFRLPNWKDIKNSMRGNIFVDGRNIYDRDEMKTNGFNYQSIGK